MRQSQGAMGWARKKCSMDKPADHRLVLIDYIWKKLENSCDHVLRNSFAARHWGFMEFKERCNRF